MIVPLLALLHVRCNLAAVGRIYIVYDFYCFTMSSGISQQMKTIFCKSRTIVLVKPVEPFFQARRHVDGTLHFGT